MVQTAIIQETMLYKWNLAHGSTQKHSAYFIEVYGHLYPKNCNTSPVASKLILTFLRNSNKSRNQVEETNYNEE